MAWEILGSGKKTQRAKLDPRTKLFVLVVICLLVLGGESSGVMLVIKPLLSAIPLVLLFFAGKQKAAVICTLLFLLSFAGENYIISLTSGTLTFIFLFVFGFIARLLPSIAMGYYTLHTTTVSEFIAAMECMHLPQKIIIPLSVMFRFFPTVMEEYQSIGDAMKMRGIRFGGKKTAMMLEYRLVPMMICSVKAGDELSAAALTRGLGAPVRRTNICKIGFHTLDILLIAFCAALCVLSILHEFGIIL